MYREVTMIEVKEVLRLRGEGLPKKRIAAQLGLDRKTATTIPVLDGEPWQELQLDTGWVGWLTLPERKKRRFRAFIFTAVRSRHRFVYPTFDKAASH